MTRQATTTTKIHFDRDGFGEPLCKQQPTFKHKIELTPSIYAVSCQRCHVSMQKRGIVPVQPFDEFVDGRQLRKARAEAKAPIEEAEAELKRIGWLPRSRTPGPGEGEAAS